MIAGWAKRLFALYALALVASTLWWALRPEPERVLHEGERVVAVTETKDGSPTGGSVEIVVRDLAPPSGAPPSTPLVCLHGTPGSLENFEGFAALLAARRHVLVPDMPGFGRSTAHLADHSIEAGARALLAMLDAQGIERAHVLGMSLGGGVALQMARLAPERIASVTLMASIGVQELELFGDYRLNHAVHGAQLMALRLARLLVPHFGRFDANPMNLGYARSFHDTDQRPLRDILRGLECPALVLHGERDFLVPPAAAREHHRLVPQSELVMLEDGSHFILWTHTELMAEQVGDFLHRVDAGTAPERVDATPERIEAAARPWNPKEVPPFSGPTLLVAMLLLAAATLVSEDLTCIGAGLLVSQGRMGLASASLACFAGIFAGDLMLYALGRTLGRPALRRRPLMWLVSEPAVERASEWFRARGAGVIFLSRFTPGLRLPTYVAAGVLRTSLASFALWFCLAGLVWTPLLVGLSSWAGSAAEGLLESLGRYALLGVLVLVAVLMLVPRVVVPAFSHRGRRLLMGRGKRLLHFEFWPAWLFYAPIALQVARLSLARGGFARVTAANPGIPTGGFVGESKADILRGFGDDPRVARWTLLPRAEGAAERERRALEFMAAESLAYPVVLKPDVGQRGSGVTIVRTEAQLTERLAELAVDALLQEYVPGPEFGIFYVRRPDQALGELFSITEKRLPEVVGDGHRDLERLILDDPRAVAMARTYFDANTHRLSSIPAAGERVRLVELGTHCLGAEFLDGGALATDALARSIDELSRRVPGFFFGRYDVRVPDEASLARGESFKVLELNGVTSEAAHVYDPRHGVTVAYRTFFRQWRLAFEIADANIARGARPGTLGELWRAWRDYRRAQRLHG